MVTPPWGGEGDTGQELGMILIPLSQTESWEAPEPKWEIYLEVE